jgi:hypothetical protein
MRVHQGCTALTQQPIETIIIDLFCLVDVVVLPYSGDIILTLNAPSIAMKGVYSKATCILTNAMTIGAIHRMRVLCAQTRMLVNNNTLMVTAQVLK